MTIAALRSLHAIIGDAIEDIERVYAGHGHSTESNPTSARQTPEKLFSPNKSAIQQERTPITGRNTVTTNSQAYVSPPPSPSMSTSPQSVSTPISSISSTNPTIDFPSLDAPCNPTSLSEALTSHPTVLGAICRIVAAAGQLSATVQTPFLTLCDAGMGYHLPSCMRLLEASHVVEILREAGPDGLHVEKISEKNGVKATKLAHILRLLATHHILREVSPDVFTLNRISSLVDSGKTFSELKEYQEDGIPEMKYRDTNGVAAFVGLCTDEIQKASAYMTETYYLSSSEETREGTEPGRAPFCFAFDTVKTGTGFFGWLEGEVDPNKKACEIHDDANVETGRGGIIPPTLGKSKRERKTRDASHSLPQRSMYSQQKSSGGTGGYCARTPRKSSSPTTSTDSESNSTSTIKNGERSESTNPNRFRLERFGKAMSGTDGWEAPGAVLNGFDWNSLARGSIVVDVGGGIGSTSMLLATAFSSSADDADSGLGLQFIIQDRPVVCEMGEKAWKAKCPELLDSTARFQVHDFFTPQPVRNAAVFLLRVVLHDWPDVFARKILLRLREAAMPETKLVIADFVLPLACPEDMGTDGGLEDVEGAQTVPAPAPLLPNLGKASANVYWMDLTMQTMFNSQERTLRELVSLALSAGWKIVKVTRTSGSLFGYLVAEPVAIPAYDDIDIDDSQTASNQEDDLFAPKGAKRQEEYVENERMFERQRRYRGDMETIERASSRCGTPTFGSNTRLSSAQEALSRLGSGIIRAKAMSRTMSTPLGSSSKPPVVPLKPALSLTSTVKKKPSPLSVPPLHSSPSPISSPSRKPGVLLASALSASSSTSPRQSPGPKFITKRMSLANLRSTHSMQDIGTQPDPPPSLLPLPPSSQRQPPPSPLSPSYAQTQMTQAIPKMNRRASYAHLSQTAAAQEKLPARPGASSVSPTPIHPSMIPIRVNGELLASPSISQRTSISSSSTGSPSPRPSRMFAVVSRRASNAHLLNVVPPQPISSRKRSGTVVGPSISLREGAALNIRTNTGEGDRIGELGVGSSRRDVGGNGSVLKFDDSRNVGRHGRHLSTSTLYHRPRSPVAGGGSVLAAAARIDRGELVQPPPSP